MICRGETTQREGDPIPHIVWPGGLVNLVLFTVAKENRANVQLRWGAHRIEIDLVAFSRTIARFSFVTVNKAKFTSPPGHTMWIFQKSDFLEHREKRLEFRLGSAFFGISEVD